MKWLLILFLCIPSMAVADCCKDCIEAPNQKDCMHDCSKDACQDKSGQDYADCIGSQTGYGFPKLDENCEDACKVQRFSGDELYRCEVQCIRASIGSE